MSRLRAVLREAYGLVVDDGTLAALILVWIGAVWFVLSRALVPPDWGAFALFLGLALILVENVLRRARR